MTVRLEHANLTVRDIDATIRFLQTAFPDFRIRFDGRDPDGTRWVHIGTNDTYIALTQSTIEPSMPWTPYQGIPGVNHLAYEVGDIEAIRQRLKLAGYKESTVSNKHPYRRRVYFLDGDGSSICPPIRCSDMSTPCQTSETSRGCGTAATWRRHR